MWHLHRLLLVLTVVVVVTTGPVLTGAGGVRSAQSPPSSVLDAASYPTLDWRFETLSQITDAPLIEDNVLLVLSEDGYLYALDLATGTERWRAETGHAAFSRAHVTADDGTAFVTDPSGRVRAIDVTTGETLWRRRAAAPVDHRLDRVRPWVPQGTVKDAGDLTYTPVFPPATVVDGVVYIDDIVGNNGVVYALDAETGEELWKVKTAPMESYPLPVVDGVVFVADINGDLWFIDASTGDVLAQYQAGEPLLAAPIVGENLAFLAFGGQIDAIRPESGELQWRAELSTGVENVLAPKIVGIADGVLFVSLDGRLLALDLGDGRTLWELETYDYPTVGDRVVFVADAEGSLNAVEATTGETLWRGPTTQGSRTVAGDTLYVAVGSSLFALDAATGVERWRVRTGGMLHNSITVVDDQIFLGSTDHFLYALTPYDQASPPEGFEGSQIGATVEPLVTVRLEPLPATPAFVGIWRVTIPENASGTIPALNGPAAGYLLSGSLDFPDGGQYVVLPEGYNSVDSADQGGTLRLPLKTPLAVENFGVDPAEMLVFAVVPEDGLPETGDRSGVSVDLVGGDVIERLPGDGAYFDLGVVRLDPHTAIVPTLSAWPDLVIVDSGSLDLAVEENPPVALGRSQSEWSATSTIAAGEDTMLPAGRLRFARAGEEPTSLIVLSVSGDIHMGQGGGCGGRCIQATG